MDNSASASTSSGASFNGTKDTARMNIKILKGSRSEKYTAQEWTCDRCHQLNKPNEHLIFSLPVIWCKCGKKTEQLVYFCLADVEINGHSIIPNVKDQGLEEECIAFAFSNGVEMNNNVEDILLGRLPQAITLDPFDLSRLYDDIFPDAPEIPASMLQTLHKVLYIPLILRKYGCKPVEGGESICKGLDFFTVPLANLERICQMVADGRSVICTFYTSSKLGSLKFGEIYDPYTVLHPQRKKRGAHALLILGAIIFGDRNVEIFQNSWGDEFCARRDNDGNIMIGGMGLIMATHLCNPIVLCRSWEKVINGRLDGSWEPGNYEDSEQLLYTKGRNGLADLQGVLPVFHHKEASSSESSLPKGDQQISEAGLGNERAKTSVQHIGTHNTIDSIITEICGKTSGKVDVTLQELEKKIDVDAQNHWQLGYRDRDGKVTPEEVETMATAAYLKDTTGKEGVQELSRNMSKDEGGISHDLTMNSLNLLQGKVKLASQAEKNNEDQEETLQ